MSTNHTGKLGSPASTNCLDIFNQANLTSEMFFALANSPPLLAGNCQVVSSGLDVSKYQHNLHSALYDVLKDKRYAAFVIILYTVVILIGGIGNTLVVITVVRSRHMWNATNIFIANLALADVFVCVFDLPLSVYYQFTNDWIFGSALCHVIPPLFAVVVYASTLTLTMIAIDRFVLIVYPLQTRMSPQMALVFVVLIAVISAAVASPISIYAQYHIIDDDELNIHDSFCLEVWPTEERRCLYTALTVLFQYFLPLVLIGILYFLIFRSVRGRMQGRGSRRNRTTKMLLAVVLAFAITWTPYHVFALLADFKVRFFPRRYFKLMDVVMRAFAMSSSCINPFLYAWMNDNFRAAFLATLRRPRGDGLHCFQTSRTSCKTSKTHLPMDSMRSRAIQDEASNANDVMVTNYNYSENPAGSRNTLTVPGVHYSQMNGLMKDDVIAVTKPLLKKYHDV